MRGAFGDNKAIIYGVLKNVPIQLHEMDVPMHTDILVSNVRQNILLGQPFTDKYVLFVDNPGKRVYYSTIPLARRLQAPESSHAVHSVPFTVKTWEIYPSSPRASQIVHIRMFMNQDAAGDELLVVPNQQGAQPDNHVDEAPSTPPNAVFNSFEQIWVNDTLHSIDAFQARIPIPSESPPLAGTPVKRFHVAPFHEPDTTTALQDQTIMVRLQNNPLLCSLLMEIPTQPTKEQLEAACANPHVMNTFHRLLMAVANEYDSGDDVDSCCHNALQHLVPTQNYRIHPEELRSDTLNETQIDAFATALILRGLIRRDANVLNTASFQQFSRVPGRDQNLNMSLTLSARAQGLTAMLNATPGREHYQGPPRTPEEREDGYWFPPKETSLVLQGLIEPNFERRPPVDFFNMGIYKQGDVEPVDFFTPLEPNRGEPPLIVNNHDSNTIGGKWLAHMQWKINSEPHFSMLVSTTPGLGLYDMPALRNDPMLRHGAIAVLQRIYRRVWSVPDDFEKSDQIALAVGSEFRMIEVPSPAQFRSELDAHYSYRDDYAAGSVRLQNYLSFVLALRHLLFWEALHDMVMDEPYYEFANHLQSVMLPIMRQHYIWDRFMRRYQINDRPPASRVTRFHCTADSPFTSYMLYRLDTDHEYQPPPPCLTAADAVRYLMYISTVDPSTHPGDSDTDKEDHYSWIIQRLFNDVDYAFNREQQSQQQLSMSSTSSSGSCTRTTPPLTWRQCATCSTQCTSSGSSSPSMVGPRIRSVSTTRQN